MFIGRSHHEHKLPVRQSKSPFLVVLPGDDCRPDAAAVKVEKGKPLEFVNTLEARLSWATTHKWRRSADCGMILSAVRGAGNSLGVTHHSLTALDCFRRNFANGGISNVTANKKFAS